MSRPDMSRGGRARTYLRFADDEIRGDHQGELSADDYHAILDQLTRLYDRAAGDLAQRVRDDELARERAMREALRAEKTADAVHAEVTE